MRGRTNLVGADRALETLLGDSEAGRWIHPIVGNLGRILLGFVILVIWLPSRATPVGSQVLLWVVVYAAYQVSLEILRRKASQLYDTMLFRLFRIHVNLVVFAVLCAVAPPAASSYLWFLFSLPLLAAVVYFGRLFPSLIVYVEVWAATLMLMFAQGWPTPVDWAALIAKDVILALLAVVLYFALHISPRLREESALLTAATTLIRVLDQKEMCQLLADAARAGVSASDAAVVHRLGGDDDRTLVPVGSSNLDLTALGRSLMQIGVGIAGHAIQNRESICVPDVSDDNRYLQLPPSFTPFKSLLVAPMYVGDKSVGTISVHSARRGAFDERDRRFLTMLAAQGATAIANAELYDTRARRRQQISDILEASLTFGLSQPLGTLLEKIATEACRCSGYRMAVVNLLDEATGELVVRAMAGVPPAGRRKLQGMRIPCDALTPLLRDEFRISQSYFIRHDRRPEMSDLNPYTFTLDLAERELGEWHQEDMFIVPIQTQEEELLGYISVDDPNDGKLPSLDTVQALELLASVAATAIKNARLYDALQQELIERRRAEQTLRQRNRELELLNRTGRAFSFTLDLDQVLVTVLEEMRHLLGVHASSIWLIDTVTDELVCRQATGQRSEILCGWRLPPGEGFAGWVARNGKSLIVPDTRTDERHFKGVGLQTGLNLRSILAVPMRVKQDVIGVLQVVDTEADRFETTDLTLVESLALTAAIAIENARLYEDADRLRAYNENIVQSMEEGVLLEDADGLISFVNRRTAELLGYAPEELVGLHCTAIVAPEKVARVEEEITKRRRGIASRYETVLLTQEGQQVSVIVSATPRFEGGAFTGALCVYTDITERKQQETRLRDYLSAVTGKLAQHTSLDGLYAFIVEAGARFLSAQSCALFLADDGTGDVLTCVAAAGPATRVDGSFAIGTAIGFDSEGGPVAYVAEARCPLRLFGEEVFQHPSWSGELWMKLGWDSDPGVGEMHHGLLAAPMCLPDGCLVGVLIAWDTEGQGMFSELDEVLIQTLATNAAADIERLRGLEKAREDAIRTERKRLERDLHEAMNVLVTGARWETEIISEALECDDLAAVRIALKRLEAALTRAYTDLRYLLQDLRDPTLEQEGLLVALEKRAELIGHGRIMVGGDLQERLPPEIERVLYRVGQEGMNNAVKHSAVLRNPDVNIELYLERSDGQARLWVKDNGAGFDVESSLALTHKWGLRRLRDVLKEIGGGLDIDSAPGKGTMICATIDLKSVLASRSTT
jgi:PAS domain S-box-containing protein